MAARGTPIEGWWVWWPFHGPEYARIFKTEEDALGYLPSPKTKHGKGFPLGVKHVMRVVWDHDKSEWTHDAPITITQEEVEVEYYRREDELADLRREQEAISEEVARTTSESPPDERPDTRQLAFLGST